ncbi:MAG TPA: T9SS type A sorting domain-containing protein [Bacteroidales bacterium]|nr:T9SS type A sorting domain-containing protein [Bacteroidales bacterium]
MYLKVYKLKFLLASLLLLPFLAMTQPAGWEVTETPLTHVIIIPDGLNLSLEVYSVQDGDFIGVFYDHGDGLVCGGYVEIGAGADNNFAAYGEFPLITPPLPGFSDGEPFYWRWYDTDASVERIVIPIFELGGNVWNEGASVLESFENTFGVQAHAYPILLCDGPGDVTLFADTYTQPVKDLIWEWFIGTTPIGYTQELVWPVTETTTFIVKASATDSPYEAESEITVTFSGVFAGNYNGGEDPDPIVLNLATASPDVIGYSWVTNGTGTFDNVNLLNATYTPSLADINSGSVTLTLSGVSLACGAVSDDATITFVEMVTLDMPEIIFTCVHDGVADPFDFDGLITATNYDPDVIQWTAINSAGGYFEPNENVLEPVFFSGVPDVGSFDVNGEPNQLLLTLTALPPAIGDADGIANLYYVRPPVVDAGDPYGFCIDPAVTSFTFDGASVEFDDNPSLGPVMYAINNTILWTTDGGGYFADATVEHPTYFYGGDDLLGGVINFTVTAETDVTCGPVSSSTTLTVQAAPSINIIPETYTICEGDFMDFTDLVEGANYESLQWYTTNGLGNYSDENVLEPIYYPSPLDILNFAETGECTELWVAAEAIDPCIGSDEDMMLLCFALMPVVVFEKDDTICSNETYTTSPTVTNSDGPYMWTHTGEGHFEDSTMLNATYVAVPADSDTEITLTLTAGAIDPCTGFGEGSMQLTILCAPYVDAGPDMLVCETENPELTGIVDCVSDHMWATTGDGFFCCPQDLTTTYYPGPNDIEDCVTLVLIGYPLEPCELYELDKVVVCFEKAPVVYAGPDQTVCEGELVYLDDAFEEHTCGLQWVTFDGSGTFSDETIVNPTYQPSFQDFVSGTVHLILIGAPCDPCSVPAMDTMALTIQPLPVIEIGDDEVTICEDATYTSIASITNYSGLLWTTSGDGTFDDDTFLYATYTPGSGDIANGAVIITLTAEAVEPCLASASADILINIQLLPTVNIIPERDTICYEQFYDFTGLVVGDNYAAIQWFTTNGVGQFNNENILEPIYYPSPLDYVTGCVKLYILVAPINPPCLGDGAMDSLILCFQAPVNIEIGGEAMICEDSFYTPEEYLLENACGILWTTDGDGEFDDATIQYTKYTPGEEDLEAGFVELHVTGIGCSTCEDFTADVWVGIQLNPIANAGPDGVVCEHLCLPPWTSGQYQLAGVVDNASGQLWTTVGDGAFDDATLLNAVYTIGDTDIENGSVELCLTAEPIDPCTIADIDCMTLDIQYFPIANAGPDQSICEGETAQMDGSSQYSDGVFWDFAFMGEGDGTWNNQLIEDPIYTPGPEDIELGYVELIMVAFPMSPCTYPAVDIMKLTIIQQPEANAGDDDIICAGETYTLLDAWVENATGGVEWTTNGTGEFDDINLLNATYTPSEADILAGSVELCLWAFDNSACLGEYKDCMNLTILPPPTANAGPDATICETDVFTTAPEVANYSGVLWTTEGTGSFGDATSPITTYMPSEADILEGSVELCIEVYSVEPCQITATDCMTLTIQLSPVIEPMEDMTVCETAAPYCFEATAENYSSLEWTSAGTGTFDEACYTPSAEDILEGSVEICLTAQPIDPCTVAATECFTLTIQLGPEVFAGDDANICEGSTYTFADATAANYSSLEWTGGLGTFDDPTALNPTYTPDVTEYGTTVTLQLEALAIEPPCTESAFSTVNLTIQLGASVVSGVEDATICETDTYTANPVVENYSSVLWTTTGTGLFDDATLLTATYTPSASDIEEGSVVLCIKAFSVEPCLYADSACMTLTIQLSPVVEPMEDATICESDVLSIVAVASNYSSLLWTTDGDGEFNFIDVEDVEYTPGAEDILAGSVELCLTAQPIDPCTVAATECLNLTINLGPAVYAGADATICEEAYTFADATAERYSSLLWTVAGQGTFDDATMLNTTYTSAEGEFGEIMFVLTAQAIAPCEMPVSDTVYVTIQQGPVVDAGADAAICQGNDYQLNGSSEYVSSVLWSGGTGTFDDATQLNATYTPGVGEIGAVNLTLTGIAILPCTGEVTDVMVLTIQGLPIVNAGEDQTVCETEETIDVEGEALYATTILWTTNGAGFFDDENSLETAYNVSELDISQETITLYLTADQQYPCQGTVTDSIIITFELSPQITGLVNASICEGDGEYQFTGVEVAHQSSILWTTDGNGTFSDATILNPIYYLGAADGDEVILTLTAQPTGICEAVSMSMTLTIVADPTIELAPEMELTCADYDFDLEQWLPIDLEPIVANASSVLWETSGDGFFTDATSALTQYNIGSMVDKWNGSVTLTLTAHGDDNCGVVAEASITILIPQQIINIPAGTTWRGISSYVDKSTTSVPDVMQPVVVVPGSQSLVIMVNTAGKHYWPVPVPPINQLGLWQPIGYKAKFKAEGCLPIYGDVPYDTVAHNFAVSGSFSYVPCLTNYPVLITDLFVGHFDPVLKVSDEILLIYSWDEAALWIPAEPFASPLQFIKPGNAYLLVNKPGANYSVTFPDFDFNASIVANAVVPPAATDNGAPWNIAVNTSQPHFILFADEVIGKMQADDVLGAFDQNDECVGATTINTREAIIKLLAMGDDPMTDVIDGYLDGENMMFKLYRSSTGETFDVTFMYDANYPSYNNKFETYGVSRVVDMTMTLTTLDELVVDRSINVYPNPANEVINIASDYDMRSVTLVNYVGQTVFSQVVEGNDFQINVSTFVKGMYFVRIETTQGNVITKPIAVQ